MIRRRELLIIPHETRHALKRAVSIAETKFVDAFVDL